MQVYLGGIQLTSTKILLQAVRNAALPQVVYTATKRGGFHGNKLVQPTFASYKFVLEWILVGDSFSDLAVQRRIFTGIFGTIHSAGVQTLQIVTDDGITVQIDVKAFDMTGDIHAGDGASAAITTTLEGEYPFLQSAAPTMQDITIFNGGGFAIPFAIPFSMAAGQSTAITVTNNGNYPAYPIFTFTGVLTNPSITNNTTGEVLNIGLSLGDSTHSIVVDTYLRTVVQLPSGNVGRQYASGTFWKVPVGKSTITLGNANNTDGGKCTVSFRDTFLGV